MIERLLVGVRNDVVFLVPEYSSNALEFSRSLIKLMLRSGGSVRYVLQDYLLDIPEVVEHVEWLAERKVVTRVATHVSTRAVTIDRTVGIVFDGPTHRLMYRPSAVRSLCRFAELSWQRASPVAGTGSGRSKARTELILRLLADGMTDEAVARKIGVSVRTVRNDIAVAMGSIDAQSRFQAGVHAARFGLV
ncbi:helix-turn-helix domain-containing protein [Prauserella halophila]|uniref:helix-turn-helix domain-containing protein n=1 Tax=Prauserella halophila TaxID=185641 RepID=UPI0020A2D27B|nr:helix-turn-helix domain-containing protein [Prauserella halophila]